MTDSEPGQCELSILMPCLNEAKTLETCIGKAQSFLTEHAITGEIVVADNGSTDGSQDIAERAGARVIRVKRRGYGAACAAGIAAARGRFVIVGDSDDSYDFADLAEFVGKLRDGYDLVVGNRFKGGIDPGAMPFLHRYFGNPMLSAVGRLFFACPVGDFQCGLRGFRKSAVVELDLQSPGMEYGIEVIVRAALAGMRITEVSTTLSADGRGRPPHLHTWRDGWRFLRLLLCYSPRWLFLYPGVCLALLGTAVGSWFLLRPGAPGDPFLQTLGLAHAALAIAFGLQAISYPILIAALTRRQRLVPALRMAETLRGSVRMEVGLAVGATLVLCGALVSLYALGRWPFAAAGLATQGDSLLLIGLAIAPVAIGLQLVLLSFLPDALRCQLETKGLAA
jgi:hypothetical protein